MIRPEAWKALGSQEESGSRYCELAVQEGSQQPQPLANTAYATLTTSKKEEGSFPSVEDTKENSPTGKRKETTPQQSGSKWDGFRERWKKADQRRYARERRDDLKHGNDYRDRKGVESADTELCMFCGVNRGIAKMDALHDGLDWVEYSSHPTHYLTCWSCKSNHVSVMTESMALQKFAKKLNTPTVKNADGEGHLLVFLQLRGKGRVFHHQPRTGRYKEETRISEYFWYPDLEKEALTLGWRPRGKKKEQVPWARKDLPPQEEHSSEEDPLTPATPKKAKITVAVTP